MLSFWLVFFFNIERILFQANINIIRSNTYIFVAAVALITLLLPRLRGVSFAFLLIISCALFLLDWYYDPSWEKNVSSSFEHLNATTLLTIIQVNAIILTGLLTRQITYKLSEFEDIISNIIFNHIGKPPSPFPDEQSTMYREIKRARRYERPLAVMAMKIDEESVQVALPQMVQEVQKAMMKEYTLAGLARLLNDNLQGFDIIALWNDYFIIVLPETTADAIPSISQRLEKTIKEKLSIPVHIGAATFPDKAMTFERLVELAKTNADQQAETPILSGPKLNTEQPVLTREV